MCATVSTDSGRDADRIVMPKLARLLEAWLYAGPDGDTLNASPRHRAASLMMENRAA